MGSDFGPVGTLEAIAISGDNPPVASDPFIANMLVVPTPNGVDPSELCAMQTHNLPQYTLTGGDVTVNIAQGISSIPEQFPVFGGREARFGVSVKREGEFDGGGSGKLKFLEVTAGPVETIKIAGLELKPARLAGLILWQYDELSSSWSSGGGLEIGVGAEVPSPAYPFILCVGPVCVPAYWRAKIGIDLDAMIGIAGWHDPTHPALQGQVILDPSAEAMLGVGVADHIALEGYLGGGLRLGVEWPTDPGIFLAQAYLAGGIRGVVYVFEVDWPLLEYTWDGDKRVHMGGPASKGWRVMSRAYLERTSGYGRFVANARPLHVSRNETSVEVLFQENVFGQSHAHMVVSGNDLILAWVYDDPARTPTNRTEIVFSAYDSVGETWSTPAPIADDGTADFHPKLAMLPGGDALAAWENASEVLTEPGGPNDPCIDECVGAPDPEQCQVECKLEEMKSKTEIAVARYDALSGTWSAQIVITSNGILDRSPRIATAADGTAMLSWITNATNHEIGDPNHPNTIHYATYDGATWSVAADAATNVSSIIKSAMAYSGSEAVILFIGDTDSDPQTPDDRELFGVQFDGVAWGPVTQLTNDPNEGIQDGNPQVVYDAYGDPVIVWYRDGDLYSASDFLLSDATVAVDLEGASSGAADFRLATAASGQIALIWQNASDDLVDMWYALYMPAVNDWSYPRQLTADNAMEHAFAPVFDADGDLVAAYNKVQTVYETREVEVGGETVVIDNVPVPGQSDLYLLRHTVSGDLGLTDGDISITPANPTPGTEATITGHAS